MDVCFPRERLSMLPIFSLHQCDNRVEHIPLAVSIASPYSWQQVFVKRPNGNLMISCPLADVLTSLGIAFMITSIIPCIQMVWRTSWNSERVNGIIPLPKMTKLCAFKLMIWWTLCDLGTNICTKELGHYWFRYWFLAWSLPNHYLTNKSKNKLHFKFLSAFLIFTFSVSWDIVVQV